MVNMWGWAFPSFFSFHSLDCQIYGRSIKKRQTHLQESAQKRSSPRFNILHSPWCPHLPSFLLQTEQVKTFETDFFGIRWKKKHLQPSYTLYKTNKDHPVSQIRTLKKQPCLFRAFSDWSQIELKNCGELGNHPDLQVPEPLPCCASLGRPHIRGKTALKSNSCLLMLVVEYKVETKAAFFFPSPFSHFPSLHQQGKSLPYASTEKVKIIKLFSISNQNGQLPLWL